MASLPASTNDSSVPDMADFQLSEDSKEVVKEAGKAIAQQLEYNEAAVEAYRTAWKWRDSHALPMWRIRHELRGRAKRVQPFGTITAARLKRMQSIRKKLRKTNYTLYQMQDIGGCRVIVNSMREVAELTELYQSDQISHGIRREDNYIARPKIDGYRCQHLVLKFSGAGEDSAWNRHSIELQIRTRLQHAWATAVEAVDLFEGQDLKGGGGSPEWRRLFALVSSEFALEEGTPLVFDTPTNIGKRRHEIGSLVYQLDALRALDGYKEAIHFSDNVRSKTARFYLIQYDYEKRRVDVTPYAYIPQGLQEYINEEKRQGSLNSVLVEVDAVADLKDAYPNYFLDVGIFTERLRAIVSPKKPPPEYRGWRPDLSFLKNWR